jgi:hypothetical protein
MSPAKHVDALQRWFQAAIMHPAGARSSAIDRRVEKILPRGSAALEDVIEPSRELTAVERLDVYADSYFLRLRDVMKLDFPGVLHAVGERAFAQIVREYVTTFPSKSFTLNDFGERFPKFLARTRFGDLGAQAPFLVDLATLERAVEEVFHDRLVAPVDVKKLESIPPERWDGARFTVNPALRLLAFDHPVNAYLQAVYDEESPRRPRPKPSFVVVYRKDWRAWRATLTREQFELLAALKRGRPLGAALRSVLAKVKSGDAILARLHGWFAEWTGEGMFVAIDVAGTKRADARRASARH